MLRRLNFVSFALLLLAACPARADALLLSCIPEYAEGRIAKAYIDGYALGGGRKELEDFRALVRMGEDEYEFFARHLKASSFANGKLLIHALQPLSAGETAELKLEGMRGKGKAAFMATIWFRAEGREAKGRMRCTFD